MGLYNKNMSLRFFPKHAIDFILPHMHLDHDMLADPDTGGPVCLKDSDAIVHRWYISMSHSLLRDHMDDDEWLVEQLQDKPCVQPYHE